MDKQVELQCWTECEKLVQFEVQLTSHVKENFVKATKVCRNPVE